MSNTCFDIARRGSPLSITSSTILMRPGEESLLVISHTHFQHPFRHGQEGKTFLITSKQNLSYLGHGCKFWMGDSHSTCTHTCPTHTQLPVTNTSCQVLLLRSSGQNTVYCRYIASVSRSSCRTRLDWLATRPPVVVASALTQTTSCSCNVFQAKDCLKPVCNQCNQSFD